MYLPYNIITKQMNIQHERRDVMIKTPNPFVINGLKSFIAEAVDFKAGGKISQKDLYCAYLGWLTLQDKPAVDSEMSLYWFNILIIIYLREAFIDREGVQPQDNHSLAVVVETTVCKIRSIYGALILGVELKDNYLDLLKFGREVKKRKDETLKQAKGLPRNKRQISNK
uniref:Uncharacterized protein n=1 Tax=Chlorokybus atmophyticus TaxID=3144 RepID=A2CI42_CHLAT|nr:hypothetical protein ChatCp014 [Chlorokybus atmophyticus]ABM87977.1 hypothetical protein [Chlorokybus atmophyticus]